MKFQIVFAFIIATVFACGGGKSSNSSDPLAAGKKVYKRMCVACHGADGKQGTNGAKDFVESVLTLEERIEVINNGQGMMTAFKGILKPEQIKAAAKYTIHLGKQGKE